VSDRACLAAASQCREICDCARRQIAPGKLFLGRRRDSRSQGHLTKLAGGRINGRKTTFTREST
jgi:hypothetical protein